jgi:hypothetical protein
MITIKKILKNALFIVVLFVAASGCKKTTQPDLGDYPKDADPHFPLYPGGPLKFYAAFDGTTDNPLMNGVDSIRANFPSSNTGTIADGVSGKCYQGGAGTFAKYAAPNDWAKSTSFTIAFWINKTPQAAGSGTQFAFSLNRKDYSWTNTKLFLEFEDWSTASVGNCKFYLMDQWIEYINANGMPNVLNGQWHQLVFTYDGTSSKLISYIDGNVFKTNTVGTLGPVNLGAFDDFVIGGPDQYTHDHNTWMGFWDGKVDQFRLYGTVLTPSEITNLFTNKL